MKSLTVINVCPPPPPQARDDESKESNFFLRRTYRGWLDAVQGNHPHLVSATLLVPPSMSAELSAKCLLTHRPH